LLTALETLRRIVEAPEFRSIAGIVRRGAASTPAAACLSQGTLTRTWAEVLDRSERVASGLTAAGVKPQDRVAYLAKNDVAYFELCFGTSMVGGVSLGVNFRLAPPEMLQVLNHAEAKVLVIGVDFLDHLTAFENELTTVTTIIVLGDSADPRSPGERAAGRVSFESWLASNEPHDPHAPITLAETVAQMYTSGTTGLPKGVMYSNAAVGASLAAAGPLGIRSDSVVMVAMPLFHASGSSWGTFSLALGCHCVVMPDLVPSVILDAFEQYRISKTMLVPVLLQALLGLPELAERDISALETIVYAGSPISPHVLAQCVEAFGCDFAQIYGMTETSTATILSPTDHRNPKLLASAGKATVGVTVKVVDPATGNDLPDGTVGEVWIKAPTNSHGYWKNPTETASAITPDGFVRTGDGGSIEDGYLFLRDRVKDMIVTGGENVYPIEVENVLITHPSIADVAVIGVPSPKWGETVKAIAVVKPGAVLDQVEVIAFSKHHLAGYKCPTSIDVVAELPRNPSGKILKRQLRERFWEGADRQIG
jgi:long-chain acyl-CoA synthetase